MPDEFHQVRHGVVNYRPLFDFGLKGVLKLDLIVSFERE